ncbi:hypothetical protein FB451DRAFT_1395744 [Mycena latifolia]|nr:hypothetical protein FB451DRAFT_1395744 [Mycena latifolia]
MFGCALTTSEHSSADTILTGGFNTPSDSLRNSQIPANSSGAHGLGPRRGAAGDLVIRSRGAASSPELCSPEVKAVLATDEQTFMASLENRQCYRFDKPMGNLTRRRAARGEPHPRRLADQLSRAVRDVGVGPDRRAHRDALRPDAPRARVRARARRGPRPGEVINRAKIGTSRVSWGITGVVYFLRTTYEFPNPAAKDNRQ